MDVKSTIIHIFNKSHNELLKFSNRYLDSMIQTVHYNLKMLHTILIQGPCHSSMKIVSAGIRAYIDSIYILLVLISHLQWGTRNLKVCAMTAVPSAAGLLLFCLWRQKISSEIGHLPCVPDECLYFGGATTIFFGCPII